MSSNPPRAFDYINRTENRRLYSKLLIFRHNSFALCYLSQSSKFLLIWETISRFCEPPQFNWHDFISYETCSTSYTCSWLFKNTYFKMFSLRETFVCAERKLICNKIFTNDHKIRWLDALPILINRESTCDILNK